MKRDGVFYRQRHELGLPVTPVQILNPHTEEVVGQVGVRGEVKAVKEHKDRSVGLRCSRDHILYELPVPWTVDDGVEMFLGFERCLHYIHG